MEQGRVDDLWDESDRLRESLDAPKEDDAQQLIVQVCELLEIEPSPPPTEEDAEEELGESGVDSEAS